MSTLKKISVSILGESYNLLTDEREADVFEAARLVSEILRGLREQPLAPGIEERHVVTLAALRLALQNVVLQNRAAASSDKLLHVSARLDRIANSLPQDIL